MHGVTIKIVSCGLNLQKRRINFASVINRAIYACIKYKKALLTGKLGLNLRKKLTKCYVYSIVLYGAETWTIRKVEFTKL